MHLNTFQFLKLYLVILYVHKNIMIVGLGLLYSQHAFLLRQVCQKPQNSIGSCYLSILAHRSVRITILNQKKPSLPYWNTPLLQLPCNLYQYHSIYHVFSLYHFIYQVVSTWTFILLLLVISNDD